MTTRLDYHLTHTIDESMINETHTKYKTMSDEHKQYIRTLIVSTPDTCSGRLRLKNHRLEIELLVYDYFVYHDDCYEISDYSKNDLIDVCIVWFFEYWINDSHYQLNDYNYYNE